MSFLAISKVDFLLLSQTKILQFVSRIFKTGRLKFLTFSSKFLADYLYDFKYQDH
jgi:hypothetical protein